MNSIEPPTLENCNCDDRCPGSPECCCIWYEHLAACVCTCAASPVVEMAGRVEFDARVHVTARDIPLGRLARQLGETCVAELLVPARRIDEKVSLEAQWLTMGELVEQLGLVAR